MQPHSDIALIVLGLWIPLSLACFFFMSPQRATLIAVLGGDLFLPEVVHFKFPFMPPFDKHNLPYLCVFIGCLLRRPSLVMRSPRERWFVVLTLLLMVGAMFTGLTNQDLAIRKYLTPLPALTVKDGLYVGALNLAQVSLPFFLGCVLFRSAKDLRDLLAGFVIAAVLYTPLALFEVRMSPQLHAWVYGFFQHSFDQTKRWGGFRPMVFMSHGLALARFFMTAIFVSFVLARARRPLLGMPAQLVGWGLLGVLILGKSTGAILFVAVGLPLFVWAKPKLHTRLAFLLASFVFLYPMLRTWDLLPTEGILQTTRSLVGADRTESLEFRFTNENILLKRARERFLFGWGQYARNFVYDRWEKPAVADGYWVIQLGIIGVVGFVTSFGTLLVPIFLAGRRLKFIPIDADRKLIGGLALTLGMVALDWVPNGLWAPYPYLLAGALAGVSRQLMLDPATSVKSIAYHGTNSNAPMSDAAPTGRAAPVRS